MRIPVAVSFHYWADLRVCAQISRFGGVPGGCKSLSQKELKNFGVIGIWGNFTCAFVRAVLLPVCCSLFILRGWLLVEGLMPRWA